MNEPTTVRRIWHYTKRMLQAVGVALVLATICGKMRKRFVRLTTGDRVKMEMSPYDLNKGRITWRLR